MLRQDAPPTVGPAPGEPELTGHNYDGIQEYDNPTPGWWTWMFVASAVFAAIYAYVMLISAVSGDSLGPTGEYERDAIEAMRRQYGQLGNVRPDAETILKLRDDERWNKVGATIFAANCTSCHAADGSGLNCPNLTDEYYLDVRRVEDIADVVANGRKNGAMPAWSTRLQPVEQVLVASYVASLRGKNLPSRGGRPSEGEQIAPWPTKR